MHWVWNSYFLMFVGWPMIISLAVQTEEYTSVGLLLSLIKRKGTNIFHYTLFRTYGSSPNGRWRGEGTEDRNREVRKWYRRRQLQTHRTRISLHSLVFKMIHHNIVSVTFWPFRIRRHTCRKYIFFILHFFLLFFSTQNIYTNIFFYFW